jgi:tRNA nucleotidyltransferase/poly(A) polymerase
MANSRLLDSTVPTPLRDERGNSGHAILAWLRSVDGYLDRALDLIASSGVDGYVVGGAVRDCFLNVKPTDLDIIIPNDDGRLGEMIDRHYPFRVNRHGNRRYWIDGRTMDVIKPRSFYKPFTSVEDAIAYFDVSVNALGVRLADGYLIEKHTALADIRCRRVRTTGARWAEANDFEFVHLMLRLVRYVDRYRLRFVEPEIIAEGLHRLDFVDWSEVVRFHSLSRAEARIRLEHLAAIVPEAP